MQAVAACQQSGQQKQESGGHPDVHLEEQGQRFHRETATMSFRSTFTVPGRKRTPAPSMNSVP